MPADPSLLSALVEALKKDPQSTPLRLHVANLLLESGAEAAALEHFTTVLAGAPANLDALDGAARASDALGDSARAQGFRQLLEALGKPSKPTPPTASTLSSVPGAGERPASFPPTVTASVGCASATGGGPEELIARADRALYQAKHAGRNRTVAA